jgi:hypothetical protein
MFDTCLKSIYKDQLLSYGNLQQQINLNPNLINSENLQKVNQNILHAGFSLTSGNGPT